MSQQCLTASQEKTKPRIAPRETRPTSAQSLPGGPYPLLHLQRMVGNRRVAQLLQAKRLTPDGKILGVQRQRTVGAADNPYEQDADRVAHQVLNTPDVGAAHAMHRAMSPEADQDQMLQPKPLAASITPFMQRQMGHTAGLEDQEQLVQGKFFTGTSRESLQRQPDTEEDEPEPMEATSAGALTDSFEAGADVETQSSQSKGRGSPLPDTVRAYMEPRFGVDFSQVRAHTGSDALQMNHAVGAQAFTHGSAIYFGESRSPNNLALIAHEVTHVMQQTGEALLHTKKQAQPVAPLALRQLSNGGVLRAPKASTPCPTCAANHEEMVQRPAHQASGALLERGKGPLNFLSTSGITGASIMEYREGSAPVQRRGQGQTQRIHATAAERGVQEVHAPLPHLEAIQRSFGRPDVTGGKASAGGEAHEAAHVVQQRGGVQLKEGVGQVGDRYEQHADQVVDAIVRSESAEALLDRYAGSGGPVRCKAVQREETKEEPRTRIARPVGEGQANDDATDVKIVQERLMALGYPVTASGTCDAATILAIKQLQVAVADWTNPRLRAIDGWIQPGGGTDSKLFGASTPTYNPIVAGTAKPVGDDTQKEIDGASAEDKDEWDSVVAAWEVVSPYLPEGCTILSGYRTKREQQIIIDQFYDREGAEPSHYKDEIVAKYGQEEWAKYHGKTDDDSYNKKAEMIRAVGQNVANPGASMHNFGRAIDIAGSNQEGQVRGVLTAHIMLPGVIVELLKEKNGSIHFAWAKDAVPAASAPPASPQGPTGSASATPRPASVQDAVQRRPSQSGGRRPAPRDSVQTARAGFESPRTALPHRACLEAALGQDLGRLQAHAGPRTVAAIDALSAEAYAFEGRIAFRSGEPARHTAAHEVTHILQQERSDGAPPAAASSQALEAEADRIAGAVVSGRTSPAPGLAASYESIHRLDATDPTGGQCRDSAPAEDVAQYMTTEMSRNAAGPDVAYIRENLTPGADDLIPGKAAVDAAQAFYRWYTLVRNRGLWDHKSFLKATFGEWSQDDPSALEYNFDIWSNIHYGYVGTAAGFDEWILLNGAGAAQLRAGTSPDGYLARRLQAIGDADVFAAFDDPCDQAAIRVGIAFWQAHGAGLTTEMLLDAIRSHASELQTRPMAGGESQTG